MILETDYEKLYTFNYLEIEDVCDAENVPYNVDMDFRLPFNGELIHINEVEVSVFKNNNPNKVRGYLDKTKVVKTTLQPLWDNGNIVKGGNSKMSFASTAKITDMEGIGALGSDMMNEYDFQSIASLKVPIFTARLMFPIWTTVEMDMYYTCGFSEVNSYGEECDLSWGLTKKSLSRKCEYVCQFDDYPIMPLKHWYPSLYASDRGIDSDNIVIPDLVEDLCKGKERGDEDRRRTRRTTASTDGSSSLKEVYRDVSELPNYLEEMSRTDPKYELQEKWQEFHYCDPYKSFCSYSEVIQSLRVFSDPHSDLPTRKTMAEINMRMLLGAMPVKVKVPSVDMDIFYSNIDILPDASNSPVFVKDRIVKARSSEISKTLDWELSMGAEAFIAGPDGDEGNPTEGQLKDLQDGIGDFMELNNMFMYMRGSQESELEETCDLQKLVKKMKPMRITVYSNLTNAVVCGMDDEDSDSDSSKQSTPSPTPSPTSIDEMGTHQMVDCPYGECVRYKALELDPFYMTRVDIISAGAPTIFAIANFTLNLPFIVSGDFPKVVLDVNSGDDIFCVVEIEAMTMEDKLDESNQNIPTFAHVNLTVADMTTFRDKMAAINSFDEMELWISGSRTVGLESDYFFSLVSTLAAGFDIPMGSIVNSTAIASSSSSSSSSSSTSKPAPNAPTAPPNATYPDPFIKIFVESKEDTLNVPITTLLSPSLFPVPISVGMRDLHFNLFDRHDDSALRFAVHDAAVIKSFCEWTLDPFYCSFGGDNYVNASFNVVTRQPDGASFNQPDSTPSSTPTSTASPNPPFKLTAFTFNHFRSGDDPLDMDCTYESFEGLRTFRNSHCTPNNRTSLALSMGAEAFVGMTGISGTDLELRLNKLTAVVEYKNKTEEAERLRPSLLSRVRIVDGICKDHETEGLGGGVKNLTVQVGDTARLAEFAGGNHQETVRVFFEQEGDLLSRILALSAFAAEFPPQNNSFAGLSSLETVIDFPVLSCNTNQECFIVNNFEVSVTDSEGGGKLDSDSFAFVYPTYSTNFDVTGYFQGGVDNLPPGTMVAKVGARRRLKSSIVEYDESNSFGLTIKCQTLPQNTVAQYFTIDTYTFPDEEVSSFGVYDMMVEISSSTEECGQSVLGFTGDVVGQVAVVKPIEQDYGPDGPGGGGNNDNGDDNNPDPDSTPNPNQNQNNTTKYLPLSTFILELNSTETTVGLYNKMVFDASFDGGYTLNMPEIDLRMVNIALGGVTPTPPEEGDDLTDAMQYCQTTGLECSIMSLQQSEIVVGTKGNSEDTQGVMKAIVGSDGSTDLFNQVCNEGLKGLPVGLSLQGTAGAEQFIFDFIPFRVPKSARVQQDNSQPSSNTRRKLLLDAAASIVQRTSSSRKLNDEISEDDIFDAGSGFDRIDPWLRNTSIYKNSDVFLSGIEVLRLSTLNTSFDTHWQDSDEPFKLFTETLTNLTTNIFQELFAVELTLPDVTFMASLAIEELPGWNTTKDDGNWYVGNLDSSGLPITQFAELIMKGGTWSSSADFAEFEQAWTMINNTLLQRGLGEFVSRNQNITIRGQGARTGTNSLLERMLNYVRFDYTFPAKESNLTRTNYMGPLPATSLPQQTGGVKMLSTTINGASSREVETGGGSVTVNTEFLREGVNCANCQVQVHLGWVRTGDGVAARDFTCTFDDNPDEEAAIRYTQTVSLPTPVEAGDYFLAFEVAFDYGCSMSFPVGQAGTVPSVKKIGALRVLNTGVSDGGRRLISNSIEPEECGGNFMNNRNESGLSCAVVGTQWVVRDSNDLDSNPDFTTRRNLKEYTGNEGLRIEGGIYSEEDFFEFNSTVDIWPHIFANVPVDFRIGAVHVSITDRSRSTELLTFDLHDVNLPALVGGRVGFELKANKVEHEAAIIDFVEDLFDATVSSRSLGLDVTGYIEGSKGRKKIDLGIIVSQADGRGYFDIQEQGTRRMLRRLFLDKLRQIVPFLTPDEEVVNDYGEVVNPYDMEILQHDSPSSFIKTIHRMLEDDENADDENADDEKDQTPYGGSVARIDIIGGSEIGETIRIPCVVESVCPPLSDADFSAKTDLLIMAEYFFTIPGGLEVYFDTPKISLDVDCCVHTKVMSLTVLPDTINNADLDRPFVGVVSLEIEDAELMYQSFSSIGTTFAPVYRIHGNPNTNMLSNIISTIQFKYDMTPKSGKKMMCKDDTWVTYNNLECYKLFTGATLSHAAAETACANEGPNGKLLQVVNEEENDWIRDQFYSEGMSNSAGWIGLDDLLVDGVWRWGDGSTGGFTNWAQSALSNDDHHCALMSPTTAPSTSGGEWIVDSCATARPYICEVDSIDWAPPGTPSPTTTRVPTPAPTSLSQVCEPLEMRGDSGDVTNKNSWDTFFYPTKCQGTWRLVETDADNAYLEITWPGMELPVQVLLPTCR
ncbi:hypothetical protein TL16_g04367 [Triparma laevis f. inornata]|uniref:C-type lectin domain-containing protein n=1 Tax=Triparma laevis f. inornata TaxID=1714386 RepID=A0A9W7AD31_9STRA|nr:hypothetical protein TL16_g04367 [Triparma laevis f. inornata]